MIGTPDGFDPARHLRWGLAVVGDPLGADHPPGRDHVAQLLEFARGWDGRAPLVVHCWAGISRSMASAFVILCDRLGQEREIDIALAMRRRAPHASPNKLLVRLADEALERRGRMIAALGAMGEPQQVLEGVPTAFPLAGL
jgi:predicted protein tyrosine phosphatase